MRVSFMPIQLTCACGKQLKAPDSAAGTTAKCPTCGVRLSVPVSTSVFEDPHSANRAVAPSGPTNLNAVTREQSTNRQEKTCPLCGELVLAVAKKCRFCREWLNSAQPNVNTDRAWMQRCVKRLLRDGFTISEDVDYANQWFKVVAHRSRFELTKFGNSETFFVFAEIDRPTPSRIRRYSSEAFRYAKYSKQSSLPCGLCESVWCFPVAIAERVSPAVSDSVRSTEPVKHWAAAEIPVIYDQQHEELSYFEKTPIWGMAYYEGFRNQIERYLGDE